MIESNGGLPEEIAAPAAGNASRVHVDPRCSSKPLRADLRRERMNALGFGKVFAEHMITSRYSAASGWSGLTVQPWGPLLLLPSLSALHYGQAIFEGLKAFDLGNDRVGCFRPDAHARRFAGSAARLCMPALPTEAFLVAVDACIQHNREWVPAGEDESFYLRPLMFGADEELGVRPAASYQFVLFGSPVGSYFREPRPLTVRIVEKSVRAFPGGTGDVKCSGNYAGTLLEQGRTNDVDQIVWLDAVHHKYVEELSGMNIFFVLGSTEKPILVTPELTGTILPGITRDSILALAQRWGWAVQERAVSVEEWRDAAATGLMIEAFACGTAAVITPIGKVRAGDEAWGFDRHGMGPVSKRLRDALVGLQRGREADPFGWLRITEAADSMANVQTLTVS